MKALFCLSSISLFLGGCSLDPQHLDNPGTLPLIRKADFERKITKSVQCEITTFIVENKLRSDISGKYSKNIDKEFNSNPSLYNEHVAIIKQYPFVQVDAEQWSYINVDFKKINTLSASLGFDFKKAFPLPVATNFNDYHVGPSYSDTETTESTRPLSVPQYADLGPKDSFQKNPPLAAGFSTIYNAQPAVDSDFYCYKSLFTLNNSKTVEDAARDVQHLMDHDVGWSDYEKFDRIFVGNVTLAEWLQSAVDQEYHHIHPTSQSVFYGQTAYLFTLDVKPGLDLKYTLVSTYINPLVPELSGSIDHATAITLILNNSYAAQVLAAKNGSTKLKGPHPY